VRLPKKVHKGREKATKNKLQVNNKGKAVSRTCSTAHHEDALGVEGKLIDYDGVRQYLRTAATNGPIVHPPGDT
jgi:hypothetical protein